MPCCSLGLPGFCSSSCTRRHWMSCGALPGMQKCPGDLSSPCGSNVGVPRAVPDSIAGDQHPGRPCGQLQQDQPQQGGRTGRKGRGLCVANPSLSSSGWPDVRGAAVLQGTGWEQGTAPLSRPCATQTRAQEVGSGKIEQMERNKKVLCL